MKHVEGSNNSKKVFMYALSTCIWCKKTKKLLKELRVEFDYEDVDLLGESEREEAEQEMEDKAGHITFPTIIIDGKKVITGYDDANIKKELGK